jgi:3-phenylpropionate/cinnamic acid dioxygenase small subunit
VSHQRESAIAKLLHDEAHFLDTRDWDSWLGLMTLDVEYWIPAWDTDLATTNDPGNELSLIYYNSRQGLEDRVFRIRTGRSVASNPMPRTCHLVTNLRTAFQDDGSCIVDAHWEVRSWRHGETTSFYGYYDYLAVPQADGDWKIRKKKITVLNAVIPVVLDVYLV